MFLSKKGNNLKNVRTTSRRKPILTGNLHTVKVSAEKKSDNGEEPHSETKKRTKNNKEE